MFEALAQMEGMNDVLEELRESRRFQSRVIPAVLDGPSQDSDVTRGRHTTQVKSDCASTIFGFQRQSQFSSHARLFVLNIWPAVACACMSKPRALCLRQQITKSSLHVCS